MCLEEAFQTRVIRQKKSSSGETIWIIQLKAGFTRVMSFMGARDMLAIMNIGLEDTLADCMAKELAAGFKKSPCVIRQNKGSSGQRLLLHFRWHDGVLGHEGHGGGYAQTRCWIS